MLKRKKKSELIPNRLLYLYEIFFPISGQRGCDYDEYVYLLEYSQVIVGKGFYLDDFPGSFCNKCALLMGIKKKKKKRLIRLSLIKVKGRIKSFYQEFR